MTTQTTARIPLTAASNVRALADFDQFMAQDECPDHGTEFVRRYVETPSMLGYGFDSAVTFRCGRTVADTPDFS